MTFEGMCALSVSNGKEAKAEEQTKTYYVCDAYFCGKLVDPDHPHKGCEKNMSEIRRMLAAN
tara:strand:+ start:87 stop:272 length:186 start_codon:yes stop_codon:yes gene_type:complete